jgi:Kip1 ubiquitination-promoting complex protein 1
MYSVELLILFSLAPCSSKVLQNLMSKLCLSEVKLADEFLNGVLNQLNWAFSEFIEMLQEVGQILK